MAKTVFVISIPHHIGPNIRWPCSNSGNYVMFFELGEDTNILPETFFSDWKILQGSYLIWVRCQLGTILTKLQSKCCQHGLL